MVDRPLLNVLFFTIETLAEKIREMRAVNTQYSMAGNLKINKSMFSFPFPFPFFKTLVL